MTIQCRWLQRLMYLIAATLLLASFAVVMPRSWMEQIAQWTGTGPLPSLPLAGYLARQTSALYALHGAMLAIVARHLPRALPMIVPIGYATLVFSITVLGIDLWERMPLYWTIGEFLGTLTGGALLIVVGKWVAAFTKD